MANISKIKVPNDNTIYDIRDTTAITDLKTINNQSLEGSGNLSITENRSVWYGTCDTAASTQIKNVSLLSGMPPFSYTDGSILVVTFTNANTISNPKIQIDGGTSYYMYITGTDASSLLLSSHLWVQKETVYFVYHVKFGEGGFWITDGQKAIPTQALSGLGAIKLNDSYNNTSIDTMPTANAIRKFNSYVLDNEVTATSVVTTTLTLGSEFNVYSTTPVELKVWQHFASVSGSVKSKTAFAANDTQHTICTIPSEYCPSIELVQPMNGAGAALWTCRLKTTGELTFSRYRSANSYIATSTSGWLGFHMIWAF